MKKLKEWLKKFWQIVWKDDSIKGWLISILFLFVMIKFIFFPILSLLTGTPLPLAIVESCSMYHNNNLFSNFDSWWEKHTEKYAEVDLEKADFESFIFKKGLNKGDILFIVGTKPEKLKIGDVIIFKGGTNNPIIHRIINITETENGKTFSTMGDNNNGQLAVEKNIPEDKIIGRAVLNIAPYFGWVKLIFFEPFKAENEKGFCREN